jgi:hypothetical protein
VALRITTAVCAMLAVIGWADVERPILRLATGREMVRVTVIVTPHADHRALLVSGAVFVTNEEGESVPVWERTSGVQLEGASDKKSHSFEWNLPRANGFDTGARTLRVQAAVVCASAESQAYIP